MIPVNLWSNRWENLTGNHLWPTWRFSIRDYKDTLFGFINAAKNDNLVFVVQDSDGQKYLMGDKLRPAVYAGSPDGFGTGKETAARKGISMEFTYKTANLYIYPGNIPLTEALPG